MRAFVVVALAVVLVTAACGRDAAPTATPATTSTSAKPSTTTTVAPRRATDDVAALLAAARTADQRLRAAAVLVNGDIGVETVTVRPATIRAIDAVDVRSVASAIPAGLPPELLRAALVVYADLDSRRAAFNHIIEQVYEGRERRDDVVRCLANGATAASRFPRDLGALEALAGTTPRITPAAPDSRDAAEVAIRTALIHGGNNGCGSCGGYVPETFTPIVWGGGGSDDVAGHPDGTVEGVGFQATYRAGAGWDVVLLAC